MNKYKQRRFNASDSSRVLFEVSTTNGLCFAFSVPSSGTDTWKSLKHLQKEGFELRIGAVNFIDQQNSGIIT